jgi:tetratricopeptide (TPR) repeat protein
MSKDSGVEIQTLKKSALEAYQQKKYSLSAQLFEKAYQLDHTDIESLVNLGVALKNAGKAKDAILNFNKALSIKPDDAVAWYNLANTYLSIDEYKSAEIAYERCLVINPIYVDALLNLGKVYLNINQIEKSIARLNEAHKINPKNAFVLCSLAEAYQRSMQSENAIRHYKMATELAPSFSEAYAGLAYSYSVVGKYHESIVANENALKIKPDFSAALNNLSMSLMEVGRHDEALTYIDKALQLNPNHSNARYNRGLIRLLRGEFKSGFRDYEERYNPKRKSQNQIIIPDIRVPKWLGQDVKGKKILVWQEQGAGDIIQFARFAKELNILGAEVWFAVNSGLENLINTCPWISRVVLKNEVKKDLEIDYWVMAMSLPHLLDLSRIDQIETPYFNIDPIKITAWKNRFKNINKQKIGIVWAGNNAHTNDRYRSLPIAQLIELVKGLDFSWIVIQQNKAEDKELLNNNLSSVIDVSHELKDYTDTATLLTNIDLLITVDTSVTHLAGALNVPTFLMLPANPDWRWGLNSEKNAWYKSVRLFRQDNLNEWSTVIGKIKNLLNLCLEKGDYRFLDAVYPEINLAQTNSAVIEQNNSIKGVEKVTDSITSQVQEFERKSSNSEEIGSLIEKARIHARANEFDAAIKVYEFILSKRPNQPDALYGSGRAEFGKGNFQKAAELMSSAVSVIRQTSLEIKINSLRHGQEIWVFPIRN